MADYIECTDAPKDVIIPPADPAPGGSGLPSGGTAGQVLAKRSDASGDVEWVSSSGTITVDTALSTTSRNPVQNRVITAELNKKVDAVTGKGLSTNDYTDADKALVDGIGDKQDKLTAGDGIDITGTTISADIDPVSMTTVQGWFS